LLQSSSLAGDRARDLRGKGCESDFHYYGWRVVLASQFGVLAGFGSLFVFTFSVFLKPLAAQFGWSREAVSSGFALAAVTVGVCSPAIGRALDRFPPRRVILPCMAVFTAGFACLGFLRSSLALFYAICILLGIVGNGAAQLAYSRAIITWFHSRLGMALALVMTGSGLGSMILPVLAQALISHWGWRTAYGLLGAFAFVLGFPLSWKFVHEASPERLALAPSGGEGGERSKPGEGVRARTFQGGSRADVALAPSASGATWRQGLASFPFWIIAAALVLNSASINGVLAHLSALLTDHGISGQDAALALAVLGGSSLAGRLVVGSLLDRFRASVVAFLTLLPGALGIMLLVRTATLVTACFASGLIGIGMGAEADITPYLLRRYFGVRSFSTLYGFTWLFYAFAGGAGPVMMGYAFDKTGSYKPMLTPLSVAVAVAAASMLLLPPYKTSNPDIL
jgi:MFS family permease